MSAAVAFDTLKFVRKLEAGGFTSAQASAAAEAFAEATIQELATKTDLAALKADLAAVKADLEAKIERAELRLDAKIETSTRDLKIWLGSIMIAATGILLAAIRYLPAGH
jgi:hypothetical protein